MPRGQFATAATKLEAIAELETATYGEVAAKYGVSESSLHRWRNEFDRGELITDDEAGEAPAPAAAKAKPAAEEEPDDDEEPPTHAGGAGGVLTLANGTPLPTLPPQNEGATRRTFPDDFKYAIGNALLRREVLLNDVYHFYGIERGVLQKWTELVRKKRLKGPKNAPVTARAAATNGHANRQQTLPEVVTDAPGSTSLMVYQPNHPPELPVHASSLAAELQRKDQEIAKLKRQLADAMGLATRAMLDDHG